VTIILFGVIKVEKSPEKNLVSKRGRLLKGIFLFQFCPWWKFISFSLDIPSEVENTNGDRWLYKTRRVMLLPLDNEQSQR